MRNDGFRWLTIDEQRAWRALLEATQALMDHLDRELQRGAELSHADYEILVRLSESEARRMRMSELAERTLFSRSRLSHAVGRLERVGWIRREHCPQDRRGTFAVLTDAGFAALEAAAPCHVTAVREAIFDRLSPAQVGQLERIASVIRDGLLDRDDAGQ